MSARHALSPGRVRCVELLSVVPTTLLVAGHLAAYMLLGFTIHDDISRPQTVTAEPDTPLDQGAGTA